LILRVVQLKKSGQKRALLMKNKAYDAREANKEVYTFRGNP
jgi:hypothetical protein